MASPEEKIKWEKGLALVFLFVYNKLTKDDKKPTQTYTYPFPLSGPGLGSASFTYTPSYFCDINPYPYSFDPKVKQIIILFLILVAVMFSAAWLSDPNSQLSRLFIATQGTSQIPEEKKNIVKAGNAEIEVEIAKTQEERKIGLSKYNDLPEGRGMLFVFDEKDVKPSFWMKDVKFPIDIVWIDDGKIVEITEKVPVLASSVPDYKIPRYTPKQTIDYVLEITAGQSAKKGIKAGDNVELPIPE